MYLVTKELPGFRKGDWLKPSQVAAGARYFVPGTDKQFDPKDWPDHFRKATKNDFHILEFTIEELSPYRQSDHNQALKLAKKHNVRVRRVLKLLTGEVFKIGSRISNGKSTSIIEHMYLVGGVDDQKTLMIRDIDRSVYGSLGALDLIQDYITTADNHKINEKSSHWYGVGVGTHNKLELTEKPPLFGGGSWIYYRHKSAALEYIRRHTSFLSIEDVENTLRLMRIEEHIPKGTGPHKTILTIELENVIKKFMESNPVKLDG